MLLQISGLKKSYGDRVIFEDVSFTLDTGQKLSIVGVNGAGKTTLVKSILHEEDPDSGSVVMSQGVSIGYIAQEQGLESESTVLDELMLARPEILNLEAEMNALRAAMDGATAETQDTEYPSGTHMSAASTDTPSAALQNADDLAKRYSELESEYARIGGYEYKSRVTGAIRGLSLDDLKDRVISTLSGGEKTRVALGKALIREPELLILDEPTNHLDMDSVAWLENTLSSFKGALITVSHDRYFLDRLSDRVLEIENGKAYIYKGNYTAYAQKKAEKVKAETRLYLKQQDRIRHEEDVIEKLRSFNREKSIKRAESRVKLLEKMEVMERPSEEKGIRMTFTPFLKSGKDVLTIENLSAAYDGTALFENQSFTIHRGERVCVIGKNGTGKSTLLKIINNLVLPTSGHIYKGVNVHTGYYDQEFKNLGHGTVFNEVSDRRPDLKESAIRTYLAAFRFLGDDVFKDVSDLSGGERGRLSLLCLMLSRANFLILDEPTNHLDITSREVLEDALSAYEGTVLSVSHDRYFINRTATRVLSLENGCFLDYPGNYDYYLEKHKEPGTSDSPSQKQEDASANTSKDDWLTQKSRSAAERKHKADIEACENEISRLEEELKNTDEEIGLPENATDPAALSLLSKKRDEISSSLDELYEKWEALQG